MAVPNRTPSPAPTPQQGDNHLTSPASSDTTSGPTDPSTDAEGGRAQRAGSDPGEVDEIVQELEDRLRWVTADLENLRKRYDREIFRERLAERGRVAGEWLPVIDNLDLALQHVDQVADAASQAVINGVHAVRDQAVAVLERLGFSRFDDVGKPFDPSRHEAVSTIDSDAPDNTIVAAVRPGYGSNDEVLRPASVIVSRTNRVSGSDRAAPRASESGTGRSEAGGSGRRDPD
jgi:molecular chaperone GrpE